MTHFELLKYAATGIASPEMTAYDKMRALSMAGGGAIKTLTGVPPLSFRANGKPLVSWSMLGNGQQTGTPTPDAPIIPDFCGVRTGNLAYGRIEFVNIGTNGKIVQTDVYDLAIARVENGVVYTANSHVLAFYTDEPVIGSVSYNQSRIVATYGIPTTFTAPITGYVVFRIAPSEPAMLNLGSTALPYEPYGYKLPITNAGQTVPVYLGQTQTVRRVRKLVLDGTERWLRLDTGSETYQRFFFDLSPSKAAISDLNVICTHFMTAPENSRECVRFSSSEGLYTQPLFVVLKSRLVADNVESWKSYLAAQYAAGTPVVIWYVLAEPETAIVNEPLAKIGDYADELHSTDAGVSITTAKGANTLTVDTDLQPSSMTITYRE